MLKIAPSILAADYLKLGEEIERVKLAGADFLHFDVMDGMFVPNISFGWDMLRATSKLGLTPDVHLMIEQPERYIESFAEAGAKIITIHAEATRHLNRALNHIRELGCLAGVALNPATSEESLRYVLGDIDLVLVMTVNPGFGGQKLIQSAADKVSRVRDMLKAEGVDIMIEVDGGINADNAPMLIANGANVLVAGSAVFGKNDTKAVMDSFRSSYAKLFG